MSDVLSKPARQILAAMYFELVGMRRPVTTVARLVHDYRLDGDSNPQSALLELAEAQLIWRASKHFPTDLDEQVALSIHGYADAQRVVLEGEKVKVLSGFSDGTTFSDGSRFATDVPSDITQDDLWPGNFSLGPIVPSSTASIDLTKRKEELFEVIEKLENAIEAIRSSNTLRGEEKDQLLQMLGLGVEALKKPKTYGYILVFLLLNPLYAAYTGVVEEAAKPQMEAAFNAIRALIGI